LRRLGAPTLHLERPETVEGAAVEGPEAFEGVGKELVREGPLVDLSGGDDTRSEVKRVVPDLVLADSAFGRF